MQDPWTPRVDRPGWPLSMYGGIAVGLGIILLIVAAGAAGRRYKDPEGYARRTCEGQVGSDRAAFQRCLDFEVRKTPLEEAVPWLIGAWLLGASGVVILVRSWREKARARGSSQSPAVSGPTPPEARS